MGQKQLTMIDAGAEQIYILRDRLTGREPPKERAAKRRASSEATKAKNICSSKQKLELYLAVNFPTPKSALVLSMGFDEQHYRRIKKHRRPSKQRETVRYYVNEFRKFLREARKEAGLPAPRVFCAIEILTSDSNRWHVHCVLDATGEDLPLVRNCWRFGDNVEARPLRVDREKNHETLAGYLCKEARELQDHNSRPGTHVWSASRNVRKPTVTTVTVPGDYRLPLPKGADVVIDERRDNEFSSYRYTKLRLGPEAFPKPPRAKRHE